MRKLSLVIPVYNEAPQLHAVVAMMLRAPCPVAREWIFVDDGSTDASLTVLNELAAVHGLTVISQGRNQGKGAAVARGIEAATGDFIVIQDADFEYDPNDLPSLLQPLLDDRADVVFGSRFKNPHLVHRTYHQFVNQVLTLLSNLLSGIALTDMETCYKLFRSDVLKAMQLRSQRFGIEVELTAYVAKLRVRLFELPISYFPRTQLQGKKISWRDGFAALWHLVRFNWLVSPAQAFAKAPTIVDDYERRHRTRHLDGPATSLPPTPP